MHAWVLNGGHGAKAAPAAESNGRTNEATASAHLRSHGYYTQPTSETQAPAHQSSPPKSQLQHQSRMPIITANAASRAAAAQAARLPPRPGTGRQVGASSLTTTRARANSTDPPHGTPAHAPFWEGSTVDGSMFSETGSNAESMAIAAGAGAQGRVPYLDQAALKARGLPRQYSVKRNSDSDRPPFVIGDNGMIDVLSSPLAKRSSTPEIRTRNDYAASPHQAGRYLEGPRFDGSLNRSPPNPLNHHRARLPLRTTKRELGEAAMYPEGHERVSSSPGQTQQAPESGLDQTTRRDRNLLRAPDHEPHRSTVFENIDTPMASRPDLDPESDFDSEEEEQQTPKAAPKPAPAPKSSLAPKSTSAPATTPPLSRKLWPKESKDSKGRNSLRESSMPREAPDKRQSVAKKRHFDLDYDDSALARMEYSQLKAQDFDYDPAQAESHSAQLPVQGTLLEKLNHFMNKDPEVQSSFFTGMEIKDWEESGDWFLEKFGDVMHRLKESRRAKRQLVDQFEIEVAEREEAVRNKIHTIGHTLEELKNEGEGMMKNKELE
ncbi:extracellular mutant protein 11-domain-containing protein [Xylariales sp. PMI_506]|nr:extracellular mutant protein 11-domain-containing protein [Xylariales sp. PMI_506]